MTSKISAQDIITFLKEMALLHAYDESPFKARAYENAGNTIEHYGGDILELYRAGGEEALRELEGIGIAISEKIGEFIKTGSAREYKQLKKKWPMDLIGLTRIEGIGPKTAKKLYQELKIKTVDDLKKALRSGRIQKLSGASEKTFAKIQKSLAFLEADGGRMNIDQADAYARAIMNGLHSAPGVRLLEVAGSLRRMQETIGDLDFVTSGKYPAKIIETFIHLPQVASVTMKGPTRASARLHNGHSADLRVVEPNEYGAALLYFTGDKQHNIALRSLAIKKGFKLNEYGLFRGTKHIAGASEPEIYKALGLSFIPPELRVSDTALDYARAHKIPRLIEYSDLRGDLQTQTDWTDGKHTIEEMAHSAKKKGLSYIAITDHTKSLAMTGGSDEKKLLRQIAYIDSLRRAFGHFRILTGAEVNIMKDGSLDIRDDVLAKLDVVGASVHSFFHMSSADMTARIIRAMENPHVDIIFHPTGRLIGSREAYELDIDAIIAAAKRTGTVLEINAHPSRLDLRDEHIRRVHEAGILFAINSDAHDREGFDVLKFGIGQARRAEISATDVINTQSCNEMLKLLKKTKKAR